MLQAQRQSLLVLVSCTQAPSPAAAPPRRRARATLWSMFTRVKAKMERKNAGCDISFYVRSKAVGPPLQCLAAVTAYCYSIGRGGHLL